MADDPHTKLDLSETVSLSESAILSEGQQEAMPFKTAKPVPNDVPDAPDAQRVLEEMNARADAMGAAAGLADLKEMAAQALLAAKGAFGGARHELESHRGRGAAMAELMTTAIKDLDAFSAACFAGDRPLSKDELTNVRNTLRGVGKLLHERDDVARKRLGEVAILFDEEA